MPGAFRILYDLHLETEHHVIDEDVRNSGFGQSDAGNKFIQQRRAASLVPPPRNYSGGVSALRRNTAKCDREGERANANYVVFERASSIKDATFQVSGRHCENCALLAMFRNMARST